MTIYVAIYDGFHFPNQEPVAFTTREACEEFCLELNKQDVEIANKSLAEEGRKFRYTLEDWCADGLDCWTCHESYLNS